MSWGFARGIWDLATGEHVIATVFDRFLVVPIGISQGAAAGVEVQFINPDFTYHTRYQVLSRMPRPQSPCMSSLAVPSPWWDP
ncbi:hypothetical protein [Mobiluncus mulieris]|uniref:hypothetical protein n=1 Tax=Mobiluncus mulieris TaxID=2052 RepID=UPI002093A41D|nr:hypothetical protein [Mobiluncus mulieris]